MLKNNTEKNKCVHNEKKEIRKKLNNYMRD